MNNICLCFSPPKDTPFKKGDVYKWQPCIDGRVVYHESGEKWSFGEIEFYLHFQPLNGGSYNQKRDTVVNYTEARGWEERKRNGICGTEP